MPNETQNVEQMNLSSVLGELSEELSGEIESWDYEDDRNTYTALLMRAKHVLGGLLDPKGRVVLETRDDGNPHGPTALVMRPEIQEGWPGRFVVASGYDASTGVWQSGTYRDDLAGAFSAMHGGTEHPEPDYGKDDLKTSLTVLHSTVLDAVKEAFARDHGGSWMTDQEAEPLLDDPEVKRAIADCFAAVTLNAHAHFGNPTPSLEESLATSFHNVLVQRGGGVGSALENASARLHDQRSDNAPTAPLDDLTPYSDAHDDRTDKWEDFITSIESQGLRVYEVSMMPAEYGEKDWFNAPTSDYSAIYLVKTTTPDQLTCDNFRFMEHDFGGNGSNFMPGWHVVHFMDVTDDPDECLCGFDCDNTGNFSVHDLDLGKCFSQEEFARRNAEPATLDVITGEGEKSVTFGSVAASSRNAPGRLEQWTNALNNDAAQDASLTSVRHVLEEGGCLYNTDTGEYVVSCLDYDRDSYPAVYFGGHVSGAEILATLADGGDFLDVPTIVNSFGDEEIAPLAVDGTTNESFDKSLNDLCARIANTPGWMNAVVINLEALDAPTDPSITLRGEAAASRDASDLLSGEKAGTNPAREEQSH